MRLMRITSPSSSRQCVTTSVILYVTPPLTLCLSACIIIVYVRASD